MENEMGPKPRDAPWCHLEGMESTPGGGIGVSMVPAASPDLAEGIGPKPGGGAEASPPSSSDQASH